MGASSNASVIVGILLSDVAEYKMEREKYEKHDVKTGKPTGMFDFEEKHYLVFSSGEKIELSLGSDGSPKIYSDQIDGVEMIQTTNAWQSCDPEDFRIGVKVCDSYNTSLTEITSDKIGKATTEVKQLLSNVFDYTGEVKLYLSHYYG